MNKTSVQTNFDTVQSLEFLFTLYWLYYRDEEKINQQRAFENDSLDFFISRRTNDISGKLYFAPSLHRREKKRQDVLNQKINKVHCARNKTCSDSRRDNNRMLWSLFICKEKQKQMFVQIKYINEIFIPNTSGYS